MIHSWRIGTATVTSVVEYFGPVHVPGTLYPQMDRQVLRDNRALFEGAHWIEAIDRLVIGVQLWVVQAGGRIIVIDTGIGNGKPRRTPRANRLNTVLPDWLAAAGASAEQVTDVVMTHLHADHVGWNTRAEGEAWVATFPTARYHLPQADYAWFRELNLSGRATDGGSFFDSVEPVINSDLASIVGPGDTIAGCLEAVTAYGHTPGQLNYWLRSEGQAIVFCGDVLHHPVQVLCPDWNTIVDVDPEQARLTRGAFLKAAAAENALVAPCHFGPPHCGFIRAAGAGYAFEPAPSGACLPRGRKFQKKPRSRVGVKKLYI